MKTIEVIKKTREYLDYLEDHINNVNKAWEELKIKCKDMRFIFDDYMYFSIQDAVDQHDLSKLSEEEFLQYRKYSFHHPKEEAHDMTPAWEHHKANNPHHWENWTTINNDGDPYSWEVHCVHMVIDWVAMSYKFGDTAQEYYERNKDKIKLPDYAVSLIYEIFQRLSPKLAEVR